MIKLRENKLLIIKVICYSFMLAAIFNIFINILYLPERLNTHLGDHWIYEIAIERFWQNGNPFQEYFVYLPSFFLLSYLVYDVGVYCIFLIICSFISLFILFKLDKNKFMNISLFLVSLFTIVSGNIDVFIFLVILICVMNQKLSPFLLAFLTFKPSVLLVLPYFLYRSEKRIRFMFFYSITFIFTNYYFLFNFNAVWTYYDYTFNTWNMGLVFFRPFWINYPYYYFFATKKLELETAKIEEKILKGKLLLDQEIKALKEMIISKNR